MIPIFLLCTPPGSLSFVESETGELMPDVRELGAFLEQVAATGNPITYSEVVQHFSDLPPLNGAWASHPLCHLFGELDRDDNRHGRPFRTAMVVSREKNIPGDGFFKTLAELRGTAIIKADQEEVWVSELQKVISKYARKKDS
jgi:hypothetical protein